MRVAGWLRRKLAACPFACPAIAVAATIVGLDQDCWFWGLLVFLAFGLSFFSRPNVWLITAVLALLAGSLHEYRVSNENAVASLNGDWWEGEMLVASESASGRVQLEFTQGEHSGQKVQAWLGRAEYQLELGDVVHVQGRMIAPRKRINPDVFPEEEWLSRKGIRSVFVVRKLESLDYKNEGRLLQSAALCVKNWIAGRLDLGADVDSQTAAIVKAMVLGERPRDSQDIITNFRNSGTIHVFAVSGLHVMMVGSIVAVLLRMLGCPRWLWIPLVVASLFFYALVTGMRPPAMRAAMMGTVLLSAWLVSRKIVLANSVALCGSIALLWDGHLLFLPGFQLSFAVLIAIAMVSGIVARGFSWISYVDPFLPRSLYSKRIELSLWFRRKVEGATVVGSCAWCGSAPLTWWHFGLLTPMSVLVSLPMVLLLYVVLICSAGSLVVGSIWKPLGVAMSDGGRFFAGKSLSLASLGAKSHHTDAKWAEGERVVIYALREGESAVYLGLGGGVMLDVGSAGSFKTQVLPSLLKKGAPVDSLILSHSDVQHCGGVDELVSKFSLKQVILPIGLSGKNQQWAGANVTIAETSQELELSDTARLEVIYAAETKRGRADDRCSVFRLHWRGKKVLFVNDAGFQFEQWVTTNQVDVSADLLVFGKHSQDHSGSVDFVRKVSPAVIVAPRNAVQSSQFEADIVAEGIKLMVLEETGAIELEIHQNELELQGFVSGSERIR